ncbi:hypothetical protein PR048_005479 [Dryococelus australis]|uniref:Uncharacterized protein n=1 Tax=Dryococelus australis TaxID=614101 RepID=A0ABQ9IAH2_9NEOP|nr:hypothetical protein PR048_005479 [Dryococelus australis]
MRIAVLSVLLHVSVVLKQRRFYLRIQETHTVAFVIGHHLKFPRVLQELEQIVYCHVSRHNSGRYGFENVSVAEFCRAASTAVASPTAGAEELDTYKNTIQAGGERAVGGEDSCVLVSHSSQSISHPAQSLAERLACSSPTKTNRFQSPAGSLPQCHWSAGFLGELPFSPILALQRCFILILFHLIQPAEGSADSSGAIPTCEKQGVTRPGIEPGSPWWETSRLAAHPPRPPGKGERRKQS